MLYWQCIVWRWSLIHWGVIIIILRRTESEASVYQSAGPFSNTSAAWHDWVWIKGCMFFTGDMVNLSGSSKWCRYVKIFATTLIPFTFKGEFTFKCGIQGGHKATN